MNPSIATFKELPTLLNDTALFREWVNTIPFLPKTIGSEFLQSFMTRCDSEEKVQELILKYFITRQNFWKVFRNVHPASYLFSTFSSVDVVTTPEVDSRIVIHCWLRNQAWKKFSLYQQVKIIMAELSIVIQERGLANITVTIVQDLEYFTREHLQSITPYSAHVASELLTSLPVNMGMILIINAPDFVSEYTELFPSLDFHIVEFIQDLPSFVPKECLPSDIGGDPDTPTREEMREAFLRRLSKHGPQLAYEEMLRDEEQAVRYSLPDPKGPKDGKKKKKKNGKKSGKNKKDKKKNKGKKSKK